MSNVQDLRLGWRLCEPFVKVAGVRSATMHAPLPIALKARAVLPRLGDGRRNR